QGTGTGTGHAHKRRAPAWGRGETSIGAVIRDCGFVTRKSRSGPPFAVRHAGGALTNPQSRIPNPAPYPDSLREAQRIRVRRCIRPLAVPQLRLQVAPPLRLE